MITTTAPLHNLSKKLRVPKTKAPHSQKRNGTVLLLQQKRGIKKKILIVSFSTSSRSDTAKTMRAGKTRWLLWAQCFHGIRFSSIQKSHCKYLFSLNLLEIPENIPIFLFGFCNEKTFKLMIEQAPSKLYDEKTCVEIPLLPRYIFELSNSHQTLQQQLYI